MAQHGYLREYDEGWDRTSDDERWRSEDRDRAWRDRDFRDRDRSFMFRGADRFSGGSEWDRGPRNLNNREDDHYLSWRDKQIEALDRDYAEYCRERENEFQRDFDAWRSRRRSNPEPLQAGMTQTGLSSDPTGELQLTADEAVNPGTGPDPMATATLGTTSGRKR